MKKRAGMQLLTDMKECYQKLQEVRKDERFLKFGFSVAGPFNSLIKKIEAIAQDGDNKAVYKLKRVTGSMLLQLAYQYSINRGESNDVALAYEELFEKAF